MHYVLAKLKEGECPREIAPKAKELLSKCIGAIDGFEAVEVYPNCFPREQNYDLMLEMRMKDAETLDRYLPHRLHEEFVQYIAPKTEAKVTFDRE